MVDSRTDVSHRGGKRDGIRICDDELLSRDSHVTCRTCYKESGHFVDDDKANAVTLRQPIATCSSNVETGGGQAACGTFRISRSCEDGRRDFDTVARCETQYGAVGRVGVSGTLRGYSSLAEVEKQNAKSFVRGAFSNFDVSTQN